ncbi:hypothetical protein [Thalassobaculum sp.]|uniref:hypothetical protein n=1 Tax=Thalassobaculum sp. TaxID=2022740 RepID=UPI0032EE3CC0
MSLFSHPENALRLVLRLNAGSSLLIGIAMAAASRPLAALCLTSPGPFLGLDGATWILLVGLGLFPFAAFVFWVSARPAQRPALVRAICAMDWSWVLASAALLVLGWSAFTWTGAILVDLMAVAVAGYAVLQAKFLGAVRPTMASAG